MTRHFSRVVYGDGCNVAVSARSMATVAAASPCVGGSSGVVKISTEDNDRGGTTGYGGSGAGAAGGGSDFYLWLGFGVLTAGVTGSSRRRSTAQTEPGNVFA